MKNEDVIRKAQKALKDELFASKIYARLSKTYKDERIQKKLLMFSKMESNHLSFWINFLRKRGYDTVNILKGSKIKIYFYSLLFRILGLGLTLRMLESGENEAIELYSELLESSELSGDEKNSLRKILEDEFVHETEFSYEESRFEEFLEHVRDAILGMNDGLVEILSVTTGLAGAYGSPFYVAIGSLIVGLAGALSMGIGSFVSVRAQRQVHEGILKNVAIAARYVPYLFQEKIMKFMLKKGLSKEVSIKISEEAKVNEKLLSKILSEEEYGLKEEKLENPLMSGIYTGLFYIFGSLFPLTPYFLNLPITISLFLSLFFAAIALAFSGFIIAISAGIKVKNKIMEMVFSGLGVAGITYIIGKVASILFGIEIS
ncbi:MAG: VIT1/CCC1 transporter family protein [Thermoproteales archaeon]|nr:VIT1/CCC1 transporter family protein [Thermoproteales archaeon]